MPDGSSVQAALHARMELAFAAARSHNLPGTFASWQSAGMYATCASEPELRFLSTLAVVGSPIIDDLREALADQCWGGITPGLVFYDDPGPSIDAWLHDAGYTVPGWRPVAIRTLAREDGHDDAAGTLQVMPVAGDALDEFVAVLLSAYDVHGAIARFIESEHRSGSVQRFAVWDEGRMIAVAGMTMHGEIAVLGGAATLPSDRGRGAQALLLRHRLRAASHAGCSHAIATAAHDSPSARNLGRSGFLVRNRPSRHPSG